MCASKPPKPAPPPAPPPPAPDPAPEVEEVGKRRVEEDKALGRADRSETRVDRSIGGLGDGAGLRL